MYNNDSILYIIDRLWMAGLLLKIKCGSTAREADPKGPMVIFCWTRQAESCYRPRLTLKTTLTSKTTLICDLDFRYAVKRNLDIWPWPWPWPWPSMVNTHTKYQGHRSNGSRRRARTNWQTNGRTLPNILSLCYAVDKYTIYRFWWFVALSFMWNRDGWIWGGYVTFLLPEGVYVTFLSQRGESCNF